jgi:hypothetical protein
MGGVCSVLDVVDAIGRGIGAGTPARLPAEMTGATETEAPTGAGPTPLSSDPGGRGLVLGGGTAGAVEGGRIVSIRGRIWSFDKSETGETGEACETGDVSGGGVGVGIGRKAGAACVAIGGGGREGIRGWDAPALPISVLAWPAPGAGRAPEASSKKGSSSEITPSARKEASPRVSESARPTCLARIAF